MSRFYPLNVVCESDHKNQSVFHVFLVRATSGRGGTHMLRHTEICRPNGLLFHQKSLDKGPILVQKNLLKEEGPISQKMQKFWKTSYFWGRKTLWNGSRFAKISEKQSDQLLFLREKNLQIWVGVSDLGLHTRQKNNSSNPLPEYQHFIYYFF